MLLLILFACSDTALFPVETADTDVSQDSAGDTGEFSPCTPVPAEEGAWLETVVSGSLLAVKKFLITSR